MPIFTKKEKAKHYEEVARGKKPTKKGSKYSKAEQMAYARGQDDARKEAQRDWKYKNSTPAEREKYREERRKSREEYLAKKNK